MENFSHDSLIKKLVKGCKENNLKCQELLFRHFFGYALSVALRYAGERDRAIEVVDDSFMKVFAKIDQYDDKQDFKSWLRRIVINTSIDQIRLNNKTNYQKLNGSDVLQKSNEMADGIIRINEIMGLLSRLNPQHNAVFNLYEIEGYSHKEIGEILNIPESSSRTYLTRAKKELRILYHKYFQ